MVNNGQLQCQQREMKLKVRGDKDSVVREGTSVFHDSYFVQVTSDETITHSPQS